MKSTLLISLTGLLTFHLISCSDDYLEVTPKGEIIPQTIEDYDLMFNGSSMTDLVPDVLQYATDDSYISSGTEETGTKENAYFWNYYLDSDTETIPEIWQDAYRGLYYANVVINNIMEAQDGTLEEKRSLMAQAMTIRALNYFYLLTAFANTYNPNKNPNDLGVPLMSSTNVTTDIPPRATLKKCFDLITSDLKQAIEWLPEVQNDRWRVTKYAAAGVLARVYTYTQQYEEANKYANIALQSPQINKILNYNDIESSAELPIIAQNSEKIWIDYRYNVSEDNFYSEALKSYYQDTDSRIRLFAEVDNETGIMYRIGNFRNAGIGFPEMYLIRAEYLARNNQISAAIDIINMFREHRLPEDTENLYLTAGTSEEALNIVLEERRRELAFSGTRWMDMKRLDNEGRMTTVNRYRNNDPEDEIITSLEPGSPHYTFEIPMKVLSINPNIRPNHQQ